MNSLYKDLLFAFRTLYRRPAFVLIVVLALGLGIGASTAVFSVINSVLLSPLGYNDSHELVIVWQRLIHEGLEEESTSPANFVDWQEQNRTFEYMAAFRRNNFSLELQGSTISASGAEVSPTFFPALDVQPALGRAFDVNYQLGDPLEIILSHAMWNQQFGADPDILGRKVLLGTTPYTVVGVMAPDFRFLFDSDLWIPLTFTQSDLAERGDIFLMVLGRLKDGISLEQAHEDMLAVSKSLEERYSSNFGWTTKVEPLQEMLVGDVRSMLLVRLGVVGLVLLIACANVANLQLTRALEREGELAVRQALGANRWHLIRQMLTENILLAFLGGIFGLLVAYLGVELLLKLEPGNIPRLDEVVLDARVLGFAFLLTLFAGIIFGLAPAFQSTRARLSAVLSQGGERIGGSLGITSLRSVLVILEVALALVVLLGAGLTVRSFQTLQAVDPGFTPQNVIGAEIMFSEDLYPEAFQRRQFVENLLERVETHPDVVAVGAVTTLPLAGIELDLDFGIEGVQPDMRNPTTAGVDATSPNYFRAMGIELKAGRAFTEQDRADSAPVAIINQTLADAYFPGEDPLTKRLLIPEVSQGYRQIVGVIGDIKRQGLDTEPRREIYVPIDQFFTEPLVSFAMRSTEEGRERLAGGFRNLVKTVDEQQPVAAVRDLEQLFNDSMVQRRFNTWLVALSALIALVLALIGVYGILMFSVTQQTREIGIRRALGAEASEVLKMVLKKGLTMTGVGIALGLVLAPLVTRLLGSLLFGIEALDPLTFISVPLLFLAVTFIACLLPARRATQVDPMTALRHN